MTQDEIIQDIARRVIGGMLLSLRADPFISELLNRIARVYIRIPDVDLVRILGLKKGNRSQLLELELIGQFPKFFNACDALGLAQGAAASYIEYATLTVMCTTRRRYMRFGPDPMLLECFCALLLSEISKFARDALWRDATALMGRFKGLTEGHISRSLLTALFATHFTQEHLQDLLQNSPLQDYADEVGVTDEELVPLCRIGFAQVVERLTRKG